MIQNVQPGSGSRGQKRTGSGTLLQRKEKLVVQLTSAYVLLRDRFKTKKKKEPVQNENDMQHNERERVLL
jgi:hypothetical protein